MSFTSSPVQSDDLYAATVARVDTAFRDAGLYGRLHVLDIDNGTEISLGGDAVRHSASTGKVPILVALMRAVAMGALSLDEQIDVPAGDRTDGPTGLSSMRYPARLALGDIAHLMMSISDNHATDLVLRRVPPGQVTAAMRDLGLTVTTLEMTITEMFARYAAGDFDGRHEAGFWRTTAVEMCRLLQAIWLDAAAPAALCEQMRGMLRSCLTSNGLDCQLPQAVQATSGRKTGTLVGIEADDGDGTGFILRNEVGVVEFQDGHRYAVAVFTQAQGTGLRARDPATNRALGAAVRVAIDGLRDGAARRSVPPKTVTPTADGI